MEHSLGAVAQGLLHSVRNVAFARSFLLDSTARRSQDVTFENYNKNWALDFDSARRSYHTPRLMVIDGRFVRASTLELDHFFIQTHYDGIMRNLRPAPNSLRVLEVGAGYGRMLYPLARLLDGGEVYGIEYSESGVATARDYPRVFSEEIRKVAEGVAPLPERGAQVREFVRGDGKHLPYPDDHFDVSYTNLVLEQIPAEIDHLAVMKEMKRVTRRLCCFLEPWREAQTWITRGYLRHVDYFDKSCETLAAAGFRDIRFQPLTFHANLRFRYGYCTAVP